MQSILNGKKLILASGSPRRQELLEYSGIIPFDKRVKEIDETFSPDMDITQVASFLAREKAMAFNDIDGDDWLDNIPQGTLVAMQGRHGTLEDFDKQYPLRKTYFLDEVELEDPETEYERFMKIGVK